ncbi:MAG: flagellar motor switch protein FliM [Burkholderiales bacterium]
MSNDFMTQEEVDALLKGVTGEEDAPVQEDQPGGVRPYNLAKQERIVRGRMPTLEIINERFARLLRVGIFNFMRRSPEISVGPVRVIKYGEFVRNLVVPTNLNVVQCKPLRGNALFVFEPALVFLVVDTLFGGDGRFHSRVEGRDFTQTEQRIIRKMLQVVFDEYQKAWSNVHPLTFEYVRSEMHTQFANIATPTEIVVATTFNIELSGGQTSLHICIPYATLEPIRDLIYSTMQGDQMEPDKRWVRLLSVQVQDAEVELVSNLLRTQLTLKDLMKVKAGDVLPVDIPPRVTGTVQGVPLFEAAYGALNGHYALKVERVLASALDQSKAAS